MAKSISSNVFKKMILASAALLEENKDFVDTLNVFPVPDGDTGTNMSLTLKNVITELNSLESVDMSSIANAYMKGALRGARGNSGVILSQIIKGLCLVMMDYQEITSKVFAQALESASDVAYKAVTKPKEGTILTVIRMMAEFAAKNYRKFSNVEEFIGEVLESGKEALKLTPELLPVLKKAGVVDSGGQGLIIMFTGYYKIASGDESIDLNFEADAALPNFSDNEYLVNLDLGDIEFAYCTEFMIIQMKKKTTVGDIDLLREKLCEIGDSVICIGDLSLVKVHVHTNEPYKALQMALELGELWNMKIENMLEENREIKEKRAKNMKELGMVTIVAGEGLENIFTDLGVDRIISGGQTMNPSADDIATAVDRINAKEVFVFPNNKNIILAAEQAKALTQKPLHIIPTVSVPEGVAACLAFNPEGSAEENLNEMIAASKAVKSYSVTYAVRNTNVNGFDLKEGDIIGLSNKAIIAKGDNVAETVVNMVEKEINEDMTNISLFYGNDVTEEDAEALSEKLMEKFPQCDINVMPGGQPVYYYFISLE